MVSKRGCASGRSAPFTRARLRGSARTRLQVLAISLMPRARAMSPKAVANNAGLFASRMSQTRSDCRFAVENLRRVELGQVGCLDAVGLVFYGCAIRTRRTRLHRPALRHRSNLSARRPELPVARNHRAAHRCIGQAIGPGAQFGASANASCGKCSGVF